MWSAVRANTHWRVHVQTLGLQWLWLIQWIPYMPCVLIIQDWKTILSLVLSYFLQLWCLLHSALTSLSFPQCPFHFFLSSMSAPTSPLHPAFSTTSLWNYFALLTCSCWLMFTLSWRLSRTVMGVHLPRQTVSLWFAGFCLCSLNEGTVGTVCGWYQLFSHSRPLNLNLFQCYLSFVEIKIPCLLFCKVCVNHLNPRKDACGVNTLCR